MKKHTRAAGMEAQGGIVETEAPIHRSNVKLEEVKEKSKSKKEK